MTTTPPPPPARCRHCGATSYRPVVARDEHGAMTAAAGRYRCSGCQVEFTDPASWRHAPETAMASKGADALPHAAAHSR